MGKRGDLSVVQWGTLFADFCVLLEANKGFEEFVLFFCACLQLLCVTFEELLLLASSQYQSVARHYFRKPSQVPHYEEQCLKESVSSSLEVRARLGGKSCA